MPQFWDDTLDAPSVYDGDSSFFGGQRSYAAARILNPGQAQLFQDAEIAIEGQASTRFGTAQIGGTVGTGAINGIGFYNQSPNIYEMATTTGNAIYYNNGGTWTSIVALTMLDLASIVQGAGKMYVAGGSDTVQWDGTTHTVISSDAATTAPRQASILLWHMNRLVAAGPLIRSTLAAAPIPDAIYFSNFLDATTWGTSKDSVQIRVGAGEGIPIIAVIPWQNYNLAVFKRHSIWVVNADPSVSVADFDIQRVSGTVGCVARFSAVQVGGDIMFLADDGVRTLQQVIGSDIQRQLSVPVSYPVQDIINRINWTYANAACATFWRNLYILAIPVDSSTYNNYVLVYNTVTQAWVGIWTNLPITCFGIRELNGISRLMAGLNTTKVIEYLDYVHPADWTDSTFTDYNSLAALLRIKTRAYTMGDHLSFKLGIGGEIEWNNSKGQLVVTPYVDEKPQTPFTMDISSGGFTIPATIPFTIAPNGISREPFDLMQYGEFREIYFDITSTGTGRKEIRQIANASIVLPSLLGNS